MTLLSQVENYDSFFSLVFLCPRFLNVKIQEGDAHNIFCPAFECYQLVPVHVIESVVSREMDQRYLQFDIKVATSVLIFYFTYLNVASTKSLIPAI